MSCGHVDILIVGAGLSGVRRRLPAAAALPGQDVRDPRGARRDRRDVGPLPLPRHPLRLGHVHARISVRAVDGAEAIADGAVDPRLPPRDRAGARHRRQIRFQHRVVRRRLVVERRAMDRRGRAARPGETLRHHLRVPVPMQRLLPLRRGLPAGFAGRERFEGRIVHPQFWATTSTRRQARRGDRQRRDRGDDDAGAGPARRARHHAAALALLHHRAAREGSARRPARAHAADAARLSRSCAGRTCG